MAAPPQGIQVLNLVLTENNVLEIKSLMPPQPPDPQTLPPTIKDIIEQRIFSGT